MRQVEDFLSIWRRVGGKLCRAAAVAASSWVLGTGTYREDSSPMRTPPLLVALRDIPKIKI